MTIHNRFPDNYRGYWRTSALSAVALIAGISCGDLSSDAPDAGGDAQPTDGYVVRGTSIGLAYPIGLMLDHPNGTEQMSVFDDGEFAFSTELPDGASYSISFSGDVPCLLDRATGTVQAADPTVTLLCDGVATLIDIDVSGLVSPNIEFTPANTDYAVDVSLLQESVQITPTAESPDAVVIAIAGAQVPSGTPSQPLSLNLGDNTFDITVSHELGISRVYTVNVRRATDVVQAVYGKASNTGETDRFGGTIALSSAGTTLAVGALGDDSGSNGINGDQDGTGDSDSGAVFVFVRDGLDWEQQAYIKSSNSSLNDAFGTSVALSGTGDVLAVGARWEDGGDMGVGGNEADNSASSSGAVYVFRRAAGEWQQEAYVKASNTGMNDNFGVAIALSDDGETLAVGATEEDSSATGINGDGDDDGADESGAVYVFSNAHQWEQQAYIKASNTDAGDKFGSSLALSATGDILAVGAILEDSADTGINGDEHNDVAFDSGAVYVFARTDGTWQQESYIKSSNNELGDSFGVSVSLSAAGDVLAVGAQDEDSSAIEIDGEQDNNALTGSGAAYVFIRVSAAAWEQQAYIKPSHSGADEHFGCSVALSSSGRTLAVGARYEDGIGGDPSNNSVEDSGAGFLFTRDDQRWQQVTYVKSSNPGAEDLFGGRVAISGDGGILMVSAVNEDSSATGMNGSQDSNDASESGAIYLFY